MIIYHIYIILGHFLIDRAFMSLPHPKMRERERERERENQTALNAGSTSSRYSKPVALHVQRSSSHTSTTIQMENSSQDPTWLNAAPRLSSISIEVAHYIHREGVPWLRWCDKCGRALLAWRKVPKATSLQDHHPVHRSVVRNEVFRVRFHLYLLTEWLTIVQYILFIFLRTQCVFVRRHVGNCKAIFQ